MNKEQNDFFQELAKIQSIETETALAELGEFENEKLRAAFENFSYDIIFRIMELLDGYYNRGKKYELKNSLNNIVLNDKTEFHDLCADFLKSC